MTTTRRALADLDQPYRDAEARLTALLCSSPDAERDDALAAVHAELRELVKEMQLAVWRERVPGPVGMALRHAIAGLDAQVEFWHKAAADERREAAAATKLAIMNAQRIEVG
jgi:hypothetical protein